MATTIANTKNINKVQPAKIKIVNTIPNVCDTKIGEMFLLISDSHADNKKIHIRVVEGYLKTAALT